MWLEVVRASTDLHVYCLTQQMRQSVSWQHNGRRKETWERQGLVDSREGGVKPCSCSMRLPREPALTPCQLAADRSSVLSEYIM